MTTFTQQWYRDQLSYWDGNFTPLIQVDAGHLATLRQLDQAMRRYDHNLNQYLRDDLRGCRFETALATALERLAHQLAQHLAQFPPDKQPHVDEDMATLQRMADHYRRNSNDAFATDFHTQQQTWLYRDVATCDYQADRLAMSRQVAGSEAVARRIANQLGYQRYLDQIVGVMGTTVPGNNVSFTGWAVEHLTDQQTLAKSWHVIAREFHALDQLSRLAGNHWLKRVGDGQYQQLRSIDMVAAFQRQQRFSAAITRSIPVAPD